MNWWQAVVLGLVEGLTEYLPVSSTGHLLLVQRLLGLDRSAEANAFAICVQAGAILAVLGLYRGRVRQMLRGTLGQLGLGSRDSQGWRLAVNIVVAFLPAAVVGLLFDAWIERILFGLWPIVAAWVSGGIAILAVSWLRRRRLNQRRLSQRHPPFVEPEHDQENPGRSWHLDHPESVEPLEPPSAPDDSNSSRPAMHSGGSDSLDQFEPLSMSPPTATAAGGSRAEGVEQPIVFAGSPAAAEPAGVGPRDAQSGASLDGLTWHQALLIGLIQCLAMWPGTSRSLVTIVGGLLVGLSLAAAVEFSFLLGVVTLLAATAYKAREAGPLMVQLYGWGPLLAGSLAAWLSAVVAVKWMILYLRRHGLSLFGWYRIAVGVVVAWLLIRGTLPG